MILIFKKGDFHIHTKASDGEYDSKYIINQCLDQDIDIMAITDHDTTASLNDAINIGNKKNIKVIPGIELSTLYNGESIHILGYFNDDSYKNKIFQDYLKDMNEFRVIRAKKIVENLKYYFNINLDYDKILENTRGIIARPHIAHEIINEGYNFTWDYIFSNILNEKSPAYVPNKKISTKDGLELLKANHAFTVLAHPVLIKRTSLTEILQMNFDGIEAIYFLNTPSDTERFLFEAEKHHLVITAGSDFHGISKNDGSHANKIGAVYLESNDIEIFLHSLNCL